MDILLFTTSLGFLKIFNIPSRSKIKKGIDAGIDGTTHEGDFINEKKYFGSLKMTFTSRITLYLSACLFSLCFLETMPPRLLFLLHKSKNEMITFHTELETHQKSFYEMFSFFAISLLYQFFLWAYCVWISIIIPIYISIMCLQGLGSFLYSRQICSQSRKIRIRFLIMATKYIHYLVWEILISSMAAGIFLISRCLKKKSSNEKESILPTDDFKGHKQTKSFPPPKVLPKFFFHRYLVFPVGVIIGITCSWLSFNILGWKQTSVLSVIFKSNENNYSLAVFVSRISNIGVLLSTLLNGFGSVSLPYSLFMAIYMKNYLTPQNLHRKEADLLRTRVFMEEKKEKIASLLSGRNHLNIQSGSSPSSPSLSSTPSKSFRKSNALSVLHPRNFWKRKSSTSKDDENVEATTIALGKEINRLETICAEQEEDLSEMKEMINASKMSIFGMKSLGQFLGGLFTIILWIRVSNAIRICFKTSDTTTRGRWDFISTVLNWLVQKELLVKEHYDIFSQCLSFLLTVYLSMSQIKTFSRMISGFRRRWKSFVSFFFPQKHDYLEKMKYSSSSSTNISGEVMNSRASGIGDLLTNLVMGSYFLSCVVILKMTIPADYGVDFWEALGGVQIHLDTRLTNEVFLFSVISSGIVLGLTVQIQKEALKKQSMYNNVDSTISSIAFDSLFYFGSGV